MKTIRIGLLSLFSLALCASAKPTTEPSAPAAAPSTQPARGHEGMRLPRYDMLRGNGSGFLNPADSTQINPATPAEIDATLKFARENFPNHYSFFTKLPPKGRFRNEVALPKMVERYRTLMRLEQSNPDAYTAMMQQIHLQDQALGFAIDLRNGLPDAEAKLRQSIGDMVDQSLLDRRERIMKLKRQLDIQETKLDQDQRNRDRLVNAEIDKTKKEADRMLRGHESVATSESHDATTQPSDGSSDESAPGEPIEPVNALTAPAQ